MSSTAVLPIVSQNFLTNTTVPSWLDVSATTGNRMITDSTGKLTWAPNNLVLNSGDQTAASWTGIAANTTASNATTVNFTTSGAYRYTNTGGATVAGATYIFSATLSSGTKTGTIVMRDAQSLTAQAITLTATPTRYTLRFTAAVASAPQVGFDNRTAVGGDGGTGTVIISDCQLEAVTYQTLPSTYIPTTTAAYYGPRFDYDPSTLAAKGLLIEESRANLALQSNAFTTTWSQLSTSQISLTANALASPDGTANSWKLQANSATGVSYGLYQSYTYTAAAYTASIYAKAGTTSNLIVDFSNGGNAGANFNLSTGSVVYTDTGVTASIQNIGNGWYRCIATKTLTAATGFPEFYLTNSNSANVRTWNAAGTEYVYVYGYQLELGSFATSYISTTTASVTRAADIIKLTGTALTTLQGAAGTLLEEATILGNKAAAQYGVYGNTVSPLYWDSLVVKATNGTNVLSSAQTAVVGTAGRGGLAWNASGRAISYSASAAVTDANSFGTIGSTVYLGSNNGANSLNGWVRALSFYNQRLSNATLATKTTVGGPL